jgi:hypothetical protein
VKLNDPFVLRLTAQDRVDLARLAELGGGSEAAAIRSLMRRAARDLEAAQRTPKEAADAPGPTA